MSKLPTAAELMEAVHEGRLMEVPLPFAQYRTVGKIRERRMMMILTRTHGSTT